MMSSSRSSSENSSTSSLQPNSALTPSTPGIVASDTLYTDPLPGLSESATVVGSGSKEPLKMSDDINLWAEEKGETIFADCIRRYPHRFDVKRYQIIQALDSPEAKEGLQKKDKEGLNILELVAARLYKSRADSSRYDDLCSIAKKILSYDFGRSLLSIALLHEIIEELDLKTIQLFAGYLDPQAINSETGYSSLEAVCYSKNQERYAIIQWLLEEGANPCRLHLSGENTFSKITVLHYLAQAGDYKALKIILKHLNKQIVEDREEVTSDNEKEEKHPTKKEVGEQTSTPLFNMKDSEGSTPLHHAAQAGHFDLVYLLTRFPKLIDINAINEEGETAAAIASTAEIREFLTNKKLELDELTSTQFHWISSLDFEYYRKDHDPLLLDAEAHHDKLISYEARTRPKEKKDATTNYATAGLTFLLTTSNETREIFVPLESSYLHVSEMGSQQEYANYLQSLNLPKRKYRINRVQQEISAYSSDEAKQFHDTHNPTFNQSFNHSEQAIFWVLPQEETVNKISRDLIDKLSGFTPHQYKIVSVIVNIYSQRYMCQNCQNVAMMSDRLEKFKEALLHSLDENFRIKEKLPFTLVVSSTQPYAQGGKGATNSHRMQESDHKKINIDLRMLPDKHIFFKDMSSVKSKNFLFTSRSDERVNELQKALREHEVKISALEMENHQLKSQLALLQSENSDVDMSPDSINSPSMRTSKRKIEEVYPDQPKLGEDVLEGVEDIKETKSEKKAKKKSSSNSTTTILRDIPIIPSAASSVSLTDPEFTSVVPQTGRSNTPRFSDPLDASSSSLKASNSLSSHVPSLSSSDHSQSLPQLGKYSNSSSSSNG